MLGLAGFVILSEFFEHNGTWETVIFQALFAMIVLVIFPRFAVSALRKSDAFVRSKRAARNPALQAARGVAERFINLLASRDRVTAPSFHLTVEEDVANSPLGKGMLHNAGMVDQIVGRDAIVLGEGAARNLSEKQLRSVLGHEWGHKDAIENKLRLCLAVIKQVLTVLVIIMVMWSFGPRVAFGEIWHCLVLLFPMTFLYDLFKAWMSRCGEYKADVVCYRITGDPETLIEALGKIEEGMRETDPAKWQRHANRTRFELLFSSHPLTRQRAKTLRWLTAAA